MFKNIINKYYKYVQHIDDIFAKYIANLFKFISVNWLKHFFVNKPIFDFDFDLKLVLIGLKQ